MEGVCHLCPASLLNGTPRVLIGKWVVGRSKYREASAGGGGKGYCWRPFPPEDAYRHPGAIGILWRERLGSVVRGGIRNLHYLETRAAEGTNRVPAPLLPGRVLQLLASRVLTTLGGFAPDREQEHIVRTHHCPSKRPEDEQEVPAQRWQGAHPLEAMPRRTAEPKVGLTDLLLGLCAKPDHVSRDQPRSATLLRAEAEVRPARVVQLLAGVLATVGGLAPDRKYEPPCVLHHHRVLHILRH